MASIVRGMNQDEKWVKEYLSHLGFSDNDIQFEPDGKVPPDFLVEGRIAVEARRLNLHVQIAPGKPEPVEDLEIPRRNDLKKLLQSFGPPKGGVAWRVSYTFKRPELTSNWKGSLREKLKPFYQGEIEQKEREIVVDDHFSLRLTRWPGTEDYAFTYTSYRDRDSDGVVIPLLTKNVEICIAEKTRKCEPYRAKYLVWWLVLVDHLTGGLSMPHALRMRHDWDKVVIVHPSDYAKAYEICKLEATAAQGALSRKEL